METKRWDSLHLGKGSYRYCGIIGSSFRNCYYFFVCQNGNHEMWPHEKLKSKLKVSFQGSIPFMVVAQTDPSSV